MAVKTYTLGDITIATAGTRQQITTTDTPISSVIVQGHTANTGLVYVGDDQVSATRGIAVAAGETIAVSADLSGRPGGDELILSDFYVDTATNSNKVKIMYQKRR